MAVRKEIYSSKLILKDVVSGLPEVGRIRPGVPFPSFLYVDDCFKRFFQIELQLFTV